MAQWERAGPITQRSMDRNHPLLSFFSRLHFLFTHAYNAFLCNYIRSFFYRYLEKCTEFFRVFVSSHLRRVESNPHFSVIEFLTLLLKYSLKQVFVILVT